MSGFSWTTPFKVARDAQTTLVTSTPQLDHAVSHSKEQGLPHIAVSPGNGQFLALLCQLVNAKNILEIGTLGGYSTIWFANSVPGVKVTSIEFNPKHHAVASENVKDAGNVKIHLGAALEILPQIAETGTKFDFVFIDADWENQANYFDWAVKLAQKGAIIFVDNALRAMAEPDLGGLDLASRIKADSRVQATLIPQLNTQKSDLEEAIDGFIFAKVL